MLVASVAVDDNYFLAAIARHLISSFLQQFQLQARAIRDGAGFVLGFEYLAEIILGKYDRVLLLSTVQRCMPHIEQIGAQRQVRAVLLQDAKGQQASAL